MDASLEKLLQDDETFKQFLEDNFDDRTYANNIIQSRAISESLARLADGINLLDKELHAQVVEHHEDLLQQATGIETLEGVLQMMQTRINSLKASVERIQQHVVEPYFKIQSRTAQLRRLQEACDILRRVIRVLYLTKRLQSQLQGGTREITKAAQSLSELDYLVQGADLSGIQVIENDLKVAAKARVEVENQAQRMLSQGMTTQNQTQVATALQVFYNLGSLVSKVNEVVDKVRENLINSVKEALDPNTLSQMQPNAGTGGPGRAAMPTPGNTAAWRATLWTRLEQLMDSIYSACGQVHHLQKVLAKKRDPVTHVCFVEELLKDGKSCTTSFWNSVTLILTEEFAQAAQASTFLKQAFEGEYPKLLRLYNDLWSRLQQFSSASNAPTTGIALQIEPSFSLFPSAGDQFSLSPEQALKNSLAPFENAYLSRSLSRLLDPINLVFPSGARNPPSREELASIAKTISSELSVASVDVGLTITVARNVAKTVQLYTAKCEELLVAGLEGNQLYDHVTQAQQKNAAIVNSLFQLHQAVTKIVDGLWPQSPGVAVDAISTGLQGILALINSALDPLLDVIRLDLENHIFKMHSEDFTSSTLSRDIADSPDAPCSGYIQDLQDFIIHVQKNYIALYECREILSQRLEEMVCRTIELFVRHASLLRAIGEGGKLKLAADMAQIEFAVGPLCHKVSDLGKSYKLLRSFRPLLFQTSEDIVNNPALGESLPHSVVLHHLFSRAPNELKSPHEVAGWSLGFYSQWLDNHTSEEEKLALIRGTLEAYVQSVRSRGEKEFAPVYPIMLRILQAASTT
ncbi:conserved oligomeric Golgi complex subunit 5-like isoform X1 [Stylophora pistillata]|uniref:conserved oligomeric Golgi complex subunit 5-like isoform X1 n=1 Tax=Stylophora pistillata TaxID=50429 RepID=UPI000C0407D4|nr:conserved oligomeric Golgi complex subunit 5-like isoform X1 [Stylophora pistillata]